MSDAVILKIDKYLMDSTYNCLFSLCFASMGETSDNFLIMIK